MKFKIDVDDNGEFVFAATSSKLVDISRLAKVLGENIKTLAGVEFSEFEIEMDGQKFSFTKEKNILSAKSMGNRLESLVNDRKDAFEGARMAAWINKFNQR